MKTAKAKAKSRNVVELPNGQIQIRGKLCEAFLQVCEVRGVTPDEAFNQILAKEVKRRQDEERDVTVTLKGSEMDELIEHVIGVVTSDLAPVNNLSPEAAIEIWRQERGTYAISKRVRDVKLGGYEAPLEFYEDCAATNDRFCAITEKLLAARKAV